jgi:hypothetical protein
MTDIVISIISLLDEIDGKWWHTNEILEKCLTSKHIPALLLALVDMGFLERAILNELSPLTEAKWRVTKEGRAFKRFMHSKISLYPKGAENLILQFPNIVMTIPAPYAKTFLNDHPQVAITAEMFKQLFSQAKKRIEIFSPYIDASYSTLHQFISHGVDVKIVTTPYVDQSGKEHPNAAVERLFQNINQNVHYIRNATDEIQLFQIHSKLIIIDDIAAYVGSANLKETSLYHNLEIGVLIQTSEQINLLSDIFNDIYSNYSVPKEGLRC